MTRQKTSTLQPVMAIDPSLPPAVRAVIEAEQPTFKPSGPKGSSVARSVVPTVAKGGIALAGIGTAWLLITDLGPSGEPDRTDPFPDTITEMTELAADCLELLGTAGLGLLGMAGAAYTALVAWTIASQTIAANRTRRILYEARDRFVMPCELTAECRELLRRAQHAVRTVTATTVHAQDLIDRTRDRGALQLQEWEIARALADYSARVRGEPRPVGEEAARMLAGRRRLLDSRLASIRRRIEALEAYADHAARADAHYRELLQVRQIADDTGELLHVLAQTAADDLAVEQVREMSVEAAAVAEALSTELDAARKAAAALPEAV